jgi:anti-sigma B factor antagonist
MDDDPNLEYIPEPTFHRSEESLDGGGVVLKLDGDIDMFISPSLGARLHQLAEEEAGNVVVDMTGARFIDSSVLSTLVHAQNELQTHHAALAVVATAPYTRRTFELTGLRDLLRVSESRDEAVGRLSA